ncbi:MAG: HAD-IIB family hydrolase, partial [Olsenella sp.]|nr:HAD-IIB family hydrolase [Olsenella sp.]
ELLDCLAERGIPFVPCTGRTWTGLPDELLSHPATRYAVTSDGAVVMEVDHGTGGHGAAAPRASRIYLSCMGKERVLALYERLRGVECTFDVFWDGHVYVERDRYELLGSFGIKPHDLSVIRRLRTPVDERTPDLLARLGGVERLSIYWGDPALADVIAGAVEEDRSLHHTCSSTQNLEVMDAGTSKGVALTWLCAHLGIPVEESVGFGDSPNDLSMIEAVGDGVAMANAFEEVKMAADHVTDVDNDHGGVMRYLKGVL